MTALMLFRILIAITLVIAIYAIGKYLTSPRRKLYSAQRRLEFYLLDNPNQTKEILEFVYRGGLFIGEKNFGISENKFAVLKINFTLQDYFDLQGLSKEDLIFLEKEIHKRHPHAKIQWERPINQLLDSN